MNLTFFPMHYAGLTGMARRTFTYDANQGWDVENQVATIGYFVLAVAMAAFAINLMRSRTRGQRVGNDPWGAATLEWTLPSPVPEYNFAELPVVTSRYPLWDKQHSGHAEVPTAPETETHTEHEDVVDVVSEHRGLPGEPPHPTPAELGIHMPSPTIKPLLAAVALTIPFIGLLMGTNIPVIVGGGALFVLILFSWLLTPVEPDHHPVSPSHSADPKRRPRADEPFWTKR
jgi:hypothetical protein